MSPTFEVTNVFRHGTNEWEELGQHGDPPQVQHKIMLAWRDVTAVSQFVPDIAPDLDVSKARHVSFLYTRENGELVVLEDTGKLQEQWTKWLTEQESRKEYGFTRRVN